MDERKAFEQRREQMLSFREEVMNELGRVIQDKRAPEATKQRAAAMRELVNRSVIKGYPTDALVKGEFGRVLGTNQKIILFNPQTKRYRIAGPNVISVPQYHLFRDNKLTERGKLTILHEFAHTISPSEFRADMIAVNLGARLGISKPAIVGSILGRRYALGSEKFRALAEKVRELKPARRRPALRPRHA